MFESLGDVMDYLEDELDDEASRDEVRTIILGLEDRLRILLEDTEETYDTVEDFADTVVETLEDGRYTGVEINIYQPDRRSFLDTLLKIGTGAAIVGFGYDAATSMGSGIEVERELIGSPVDDIYEIELEDDSALFGYFEDVRAISREFDDHFGEMEARAESYSGDRGLGFDDDSRRVDLLLDEKIGYSVSMTDELYSEAKSEL